MVEEVLVRESLSTQEIECGRELLRRAERAGIKVVAAYWVQDRTANMSSLTLDIVTPAVDREGPLKLYERIHALTSRPTRIPCGLDINRIEVLGLSYSFFKTLTSAISSMQSKTVSEKELSAIRLSQVVVGDSLVDLYIYRFPAPENHKS